MARWPSAEPRHWRAPALALAGIAIVAGAEPAARDEIAFARRSEPVASHGRAWLEAAVPAATVSVYEPYETALVSFTAMPFDRVLDAVYGPSWRDEEEILFTCRDGYQPSVPVARVLEHRAWLAFDRTDAPDFTIQKRESGAMQRVELGPFYLIWENREDARIRQEADYGWPYQLVGVDLIRREDRFPRMTPPAEASPEVLAGFAAFRVHCSRCHALNGEGGSIGPELNAGASPVRTHDRAWLRRWIEDPSGILPTARMPALNPALPDRARTVDEIMAYLEAMATAREAAPVR